MRPQPFTVSALALAAEAANLMEQRKISSVLVLDAQGLLCGALTSNDLMRAKVI
jgi:arabinose-5-phosphate isomerase